MSTLQQLFLDAHALLSEDSNWATGATAKDTWGHAVPPCAPTAVAWDIEGALSVVIGGFIPIEALQLLDRAVLEICPIPMERIEGEGDTLDWDYVRYEAAHVVNDWRGLGVVLAILAHAAKLAEGR